MNLEPKSFYFSTANNVSVSFFLRCAFGLLGQRLLDIERTLRGKRGGKICRDGPWWNQTRASADTEAQPIIIDTIYHVMNDQ